ncbi:MAG: hypothetical protein WEA58_09580 [Balneolaceae bacterium]
MMNKQPILLGITLLLTFVFVMDLSAQSPAKYICDKFDGELSDIIEERSFVGDTYRCDVEEQWDMMIMSKVNELIISDQFFDNAQEWKETYVDTESYFRRSFSFESDEFYIVNLYVPFEKETTYFFVSD